jgi:thymidylate synthase ThyX
LSIEAKVVAHSRCKATGREVMSMLLTYPWFAHPDFMTHRVFSRNAASSRAIPVSKMLGDVWRNPALPARFGAAKKGMQDGGTLPAGKARLVRALWLLARYPAMLAAWLLLRLGVHKQVANMVLLPWLHITVLVTSTEWRNFYRLRFHKDARPEIQELAGKMLRAHAASTPEELEPGDWHLPFFRPEDACVSGRPDAAEAWGKDLTGELLKRCTARCARTSYRNFYGKDSVADDLRLHDDLMKNGHWSPFEHCCRAEADERFRGNLRGYTPYRKLFRNESNDDGRPFDAAALLAEVEAAYAA